VRAGVARTASLPALEIAVARGSAAPAVPATPAEERIDSAVAMPWRWIALVFAVLWLATLGWALRGRAQRGSLPTQPSQPAPQAAPTSSRALQDVLRAGDLAEVEQALCALTQPPQPSLEALARRIADPEQRAALARLQQARWGDGDPGAARATLRDAFARGPVWRSAGAPADPADALLPPLYPPPRG
jgi:hypothetical protein